MFVGATRGTRGMNHLYYGDNLDWLRNRQAFPDASVDLIYLDPPFNSNASYNVLFRGPKGGESPAQIEAFDDTWTWSDLTSGRALQEVKESPYQDAAKMLDAMVGFLGRNAMTAYLCMMGVRLVELHRVLKPTGSLYLHCDPTASHYLKVLLDAVFGARSFRNEIDWQRTTTHSDSKTWSNNADCILFYSKREKGFTWNTPREPHSADYLSSKYRHDDADGRGKYRLDNMTSPSPRPNMMYVWKGFPYPEKGWRYSEETMARLDGEGRVWYPKSKNGEYETSKRPQLKRYLSEMEGGVIGDIWTDIRPLNSQAQERLGYPTQKPVALLERILLASSNEGDTVLDPFCGCGTTVHAAQKLGRRWLGIDVTHLAISLIETRLKDAFGDKAAFTVHGTPKDVGAARDFFDRDDRTKKEFEKWACGLIAAYPQGGGKKGADGGIDGTFWFGPAKEWKAVVSVKGGTNVGVGMVRDLDSATKREGAHVGILLTLEPPTRNMVAEAAQMGTFETGSFGTGPRIQVVTVEAALRDGPAALWVNRMRPAGTYKAAPWEEDGKAQAAWDL